MKVCTKPAHEPSSNVVENEVSLHAPGLTPKTPIIRDYRPEDLPQLETIVRCSRGGYKVTHLDGTLCVVKKVEEIDGIVTGFLTIQVDIDSEPWAHPEMSAEARMKTLQRLRLSSLQELYSQLSVMFARDTNSEEEGYHDEREH